MKCTQYVHVLIEVIQKYHQYHLNLEIIIFVIQVFLLFLMLVEDLEGIVMAIFFLITLYGMELVCGNQNTRSLSNPPLFYRKLPSTTI